MSPSLEQIFSAILNYRNEIMSGAAAKPTKDQAKEHPIDGLMTIAISLPQDVVEDLGSKWEDLSRGVLEAALAEGYRQDLLSAEQLRRSLGLESRFEVDAFLKRHKVSTTTIEDLDADRETLRRALGERTR